MRKEIFLKTFLVLIILNIVMMVATKSCVFAANENYNNYENDEIAVTAKSSGWQIIDAGKAFIDEGRKGADEIDSEGMGTDPEDFVSEFIGIGQILVAVGVATLLIVTAVMAIKWITAKPDQKAKLQQQLIGLVVSAVVIFGAIGIWNLVRGIMIKVEDAQTSTIPTAQVVYLNQLRN